MNPRTRDPLIFAAVSDIAGKTRGKAFPAADLDLRLKRGVGWAPTCVQITCFDSIAPSPYGAVGEVLLMPQREAEVRLDFGDGTPREHYFLCDIRTLDGRPWECCTRSILKSALQRLHRLAGVHLHAAFEHEFQIRGDPLTENESYGLNGFSRRRLLGETLMWALRQTGLEPDSFMREHGAEQYEFTIKPRRGVGVADAAVIARETTRLTARLLGEEATFAPIRDIAGVGNGVHIHMSLRDDADGPAAHDAEGPHGLSRLGGSFAAGVLRHLDSILALTAASAVSYQRLTPHRWSVAYNNLGFEDREAALRIAPTVPQSPVDTARQFNLEYRAADASASPHLALAAVVHAGAQGIEEELPTPPVSGEDLSLLSASELGKRGYSRNPETLEEALERMNASATVASWFPERFLSIYTAHKRHELSLLEGKSVEEQCAAYERTY